MIDPESIVCLIHLNNLFLFFYLVNPFCSWVSCHMLFVIKYQNRSITSIRYLSYWTRSTFIISANYYPIYPNDCLSILSSQEIILLLCF